MAVVSVSVLKAKLSEYMARVKAGEELTVTERGKPVAYLAPIKPADTDERARLERLAAKGLVRLATRKLPEDFWDLPRPTVPDGAAVKAIIADRGEREDAILGSLGRDTDLREPAPDGGDSKPPARRCRKSHQLAH